jgi:6-phosphogluconate dehydrogenase
MGRNLALNWHDHGYEVMSFDPDPAARERYLVSGTDPVFSDLAGLIQALPVPRIICLMVPDSKVQALALEIMPFLSSGDILVDAGNSHFELTHALQARCRPLGIHWLGVGLSGGEQGARHGPAVMAGGDAAAIAAIAPLFESIVAKAADGRPCFTAVGPAGAGHFAKMVHNGIEYADMQLIAEVAYLLRNLCGMKPGEVASVFRGWNEGELASYLLEVAADVLSAVDVDGMPLIDKIVDQASQKGTGQWLVSSAMTLGVAVPSIAAAVFARCQSATLNARHRMCDPDPRLPLHDVDTLALWLHEALLAGRIVAFAQGLAVMKAASDQYGWNVNLAALALGWRGGCIIRCQLLEKIAIGLREYPEDSDLLAVPAIGQRLVAACSSWRSVLALAVKSGIPVPSLAAGLQWLDTFRSERLWTDLIQGQRDYFGAHGFLRCDRPGIQHHEWISK